MSRSSLALILCLLLICSVFIPINLALNVKFSKIEQPTVYFNGGNILYVGGSGPGNYTRIQDAIDNASDGDMVFVFNGTYFGFIIINKSIYLIGEDKNTTFIIGYVAFTISIITDWVNISGFTIQNEARSGEGVRIDSCYNNFIGNIIDIPNDNMRISGDYNTISGNKIAGDSIILSGDNNTIFSNTITNNYHGIYLTDSYNNIIANNSFFNSGLFFTEQTIWNNIIINNTINGKPLVYVCDESDGVIDVYAGQIILVNCTNITIQKQKIFNTTVGILIWGSNSCFISSNTIAGNHYGISIYGWNNTINNNTITNNNYEGIRLFGNSNTISGNTISNNDDGIYLYNSAYNKIIENIITSNNYDAIRISGYNNTISDNTISNNERGIGLISQSDNNIIYHNNFINNEKNANGYGLNTWDDGDYGNYWSDYKEKYPNAKKSLFKPWKWNTPYEIPGGINTDNCPLINEWPNSKSRNILNNEQTFNFHLLRFIDMFLSYFN